MSGEAVLVPLVWESIAGVAGAVEATVGARKEAARREAEAQRERIEAWQEFQSRQHETQAQLRHSREVVQQAQQQLINSGLQEAATRVHGAAVAEGFVESGGALSDQRAAGLMTHLERQLGSLPAELFNDERLPFARLRSQLQRMQQASVLTIDEVDALSRTLQRSFADYVQRAEQEAEQQAKQLADAQRLLTQILEARALSMDDRDAAALQRLQEKLVVLLAEEQISPAALDVISNRFNRLRDKVENAVAADEMNDYLATRVTQHLNAMGYATLSAFSDKQAGRGRNAEFALPDGDRLRVALQSDFKMGFQLSHETGTVVEKTLSGEALSFFRQQEARWCRDMKELIRRLIKDGVPYQVQFERDVADESIPVVIMEGVDELLDEEDEDRRPQRRKRERQFK
jgi:RecA/RadA recombinase